MLSRREFIRQSAILGLGAMVWPTLGFSGPEIRRRLKLIVLGIDGMDPHLTRIYMSKGYLPHFERLMRRGGMGTVQTSFPPQSPVAWSGFSVGASSSVHGIYDFIHRDPKTMTPYLSTSEVTPASRAMSIGNWRIPLGGGEARLLRQGEPFWAYLEDYDISSTIFKMPGNFPCQSNGTEMVSGMGTPDIHGGYGQYTLYAESDAVGTIQGGQTVQVAFKNHKARTFLTGPKNSLRRDRPDIQVPFSIWRDPKESVVRIRVQGHEVLLNEGEWSRWIRVSFEMMPYLYDVEGIFKILVQSVHPTFRMYVSPVNIDPSDPVLPVVSPPEYGKDLVDNVGLFYTQGLPADTKALSSGVLTDREFRELSGQITSERHRLLDHELRRFAKRSGGLLFFYYSTIDQGTHMFWRVHDEKHMLYSDQLNKKHGDMLPQLYMEMDRGLGKVMDQFDIDDPNFRLIVMSDHGFAPFRRQVNVNRLLHEKGYIKLFSRADLGSGGYFRNVRWERTAAYALGINGIYLNLENREKFGSVAESDRRRLTQKIKDDLMSVRDPKTGETIVSRIRITDDAEKSVHPDAPDLLIGWRRGYRASWESMLGGFSVESIRDNDDKWSGDHCIDPAFVPAVLFSNRQPKLKEPMIYDITATILDEFGIPVPDQMVGRSIFKG